MPNSIVGEEAASVQESVAIQGFHSLKDVFQGAEASLGLRGGALSAMAGTLLCLGTTSLTGEPARLPAAGRDCPP